MKGKLDINLYKNSILAYSKKDINYEIIDNAYIFYLDDVKNTLLITEKELKLVRDASEYNFALTITEEKNTCRYLLKELDSYVDIMVDDGSFNYIDKSLELNYQLESDDSFTTIKIEFKE